MTSKVIEAFYAATTRVFVKFDDTDVYYIHFEDI